MKIKGKEHSPGKYGHANCNGKWKLSSNLAP